MQKDKSGHFIWMAYFRCWNVVLWWSAWSRNLRERMTFVSKIPSATPSFAILLFSSSVEVRSDLQCLFCSHLLGQASCQQCLLILSRMLCSECQLFVFVCQVLQTCKFMACHSAGYQKMIPANLSHDSCFQLFVCYLQISSDLFWYTCFLFESSKV